jgi:hypothetical protein
MRTTCKVRVALVLLLLVSGVWSLGCSGGGPIVSSDGTYNADKYVRYLDQAPDYHGEVTEEVAIFMAKAYTEEFMLSANVPLPDWGNWELTATTFTYPDDYASAGETSFFVVVGNAQIEEDWRSQEVITVYTTETSIRDGYPPGFLTDQDLDALGVSDEQRQSHEEQYGSDAS